MPRLQLQFAAAAVLATTAAPIVAAPADAAPAFAAATYRSCAQLHRVYPNGVGKKGATDKANGQPKRNPVRNFRVDTRLYNSLPRTLDRDRDGVACERHTGTSTSTRRTTTRTAPKTVTVKGKVITTREAPVGFVSPSGNIMCDMSRCDIIDRTYRVPKRPSWCDTDWGNTFFLNRSAYVGCAGDSIWGTATIGRRQNTWFVKTGQKPYRGNQAVLPYGWTLRQGGFSCTSATTGVTCTNLNTRHGFTLSKAKYRLF